MKQSIVNAGDRHFDIVVIAGSRGGVQALQKVLSGLPADFPAPIVIVQHRTSAAPSVLSRVLARCTALRVENVVPNEPLAPSTVYIAPPNLHVIVTPKNRLALTDGHRVHHVLSSADPLFFSAAQNYGPGVLGVVLTGQDSDAAEGARAIKAAGGTVLAQDRSSSESFEMPAAAIATGSVDAVLPLEDIAPALRQLVKSKRVPNNV